VIFALALVCAGQTSSITVTLAGQIVSEGFIEWKVFVRKLLLHQFYFNPPHPGSFLYPFLRRLITRCISLVPSVVVAVAVEREGINTPVRIASGPLRSSPIRGVPPHLLDLEGDGHVSEKTTTRGKGSWPNGEKVGANFCWVRDI